MREGVAQGESREEFTNQVKAAYELIRLRNAAKFVVEKYERLVPLPDSSNPQTEFRVGDRKRWEALKSEPVFRDLIAEEESIFTGGASPQEVAQYATVYQRAYELVENMVSQLNSIDASAYLAASAIRRVRGDVPWDELDKGVIDNMISERLAEKEASKKASGEHMEFLSLMHGVHGAVEGMEAKAVLAAHEKKAKERGFGSADEMYAADVDMAKEFRARIGDARFKELTSDINSGYGMERRKLVEGE